MGGVASDIEDKGRKEGKLVQVVVHQGGKE